MSRLTSFTSALYVVAAGSLLACSSSSDSKGAAPTITNFVLTPTTLTVGQNAKLDGSMTIEDADGDIAGASGEVLFPDGKIAPIQDVSLSAGTAKSAPVVYTIPSLPVPIAGEYTVSVQARDHAGNQSAKAVVKLTAQ
ncbi:hypothetical protein BH11MYX4_BH11MYX4_44920 [soil metagenome]